MTASRSRNATRPTRPGIRLHGFFLFLATLFAAYILLQSPDTVLLGKPNTGLIFYNAQSTAPTNNPGLSFPVSALQWTWTGSEDSMWGLALGNTGSTAITSHYGPYFTGYPIAKLFSLPGNGVPFFTYVVPGTVYQSNATQVSAAKNADVEVRISAQTASFGATSATMTIQRYSSAAPYPTWTYTFPTPVPTGLPQLNVRTSNAGKIVSLQQAGSTITGIIFNPGNITGVPDKTFTINSLSAPVGTALSGDGQWLAAVINGQLYTYDLAQATVTGTYLNLYNAFPGTYPNNQRTCLSFSDDGKVLVIGTNPGAGAASSSIWERNTSNQYTLVRTINLPAGQSCDVLRVSPIGNRIAVASHGLTNPLSQNSVKILSYRRSGSTWANTPSDSVNYTIPSGTLADVPLDMGMDDTGTRFVVGLTGNGSAPEAYAFDSSLSTNQPIWSVDLPGSVYGISISPDGKKILVSSRTTHTTQATGHSEMRYYTLG